LTYSAPPRSGKTERRLTDHLQVVHSSFGRLRVYLPHWNGPAVRQAIEQFQELPGVLRVEASGLTRNVLFQYNPRQTNPMALLKHLKDSRPAPAGRPAPLPPAAGVGSPAAPGGPTAPPSVLIEGKERQRRAHIAVRGLDRDPRLVQKLVQTLESLFGVRARPSQLTGRLVVDYDSTQVKLEELLVHVSRQELPSHQGEDRPPHPLDPTPLWQNAARALGALVGLGFITARQLFFPGSIAPGGASVAGAMAAAVYLVQGYPPTRKGLRRLLGRARGEVLATSTGIIALSLASMPLGLVVSGVEALLGLEEILARRSSFRRYEESLDPTTSNTPGQLLRLEAGMRVPRQARVVEGTGSTTTRSGRNLPLRPGQSAPAGGIVQGGPFLVELDSERPFHAEPRPAPLARTLHERYLQIAAPSSVAVAGLTGLLTGSWLRFFESLMLLSPLTAVVGREAANSAASGRALRAGATVVHSRHDRVIHRPDVLLLDGPRLLIDGIEIDQVMGRRKEEGGRTSPIYPPDDVLRLAAAISEATNSPWGQAFQGTAHPQATEGTFDGRLACAKIGGTLHFLRPITLEDRLAWQGSPLPPLGDTLVLALGSQVTGRRQAGGPLGLVSLRPRLNPGVQLLVEQCRRLKIELAVLPGDAPSAARFLAERAGVSLAHEDDGLAVIRKRQRRGKRVAFASDSARAAQAFEACDLAIGLARGHACHFPARADVLAPDLRGVADLLEAGARRDQVVRESVYLSGLANAVGLGMTLQGPFGPEGATMAVYLASLAAMGLSWWRLRGGARPETALAYLTDPRPERWGRRGILDVLRSFNTTEQGLSTTEARMRRVVPLQAGGKEDLLAALRNQVRAPITALLTGGACLTLVLGQPLNTALLAVTISLNVAAGVWQERQVGQAAHALEQMSAATARVLRDGQPQIIPANEVVPGDLLLLGPGDRIAADARLLAGSGLEVGEAALTGESAPVGKGPLEQSEARRIVLEGSDVIVGTGQATVVAVGRQTRLGATAAALNLDTGQESVLGNRLGRVLHVGLPVALAGGALVTLTGMFHGQGSLAAMITLGVTSALSAIPEGLPLLAGVGQAAVSRRLAKRNALVRRLAGIEALGRVDVTCTDKTGTLTEGRLTLTLLADLEQELSLPAVLPEDFRTLLVTAGLASPSPSAPTSGVQTTDRAVLRAAQEAGLLDELKQPRLAEVPFDSARAFYASQLADRLCLKGAPERLLARCARVRKPAGAGRPAGTDQPLDQEGRQALLGRAASLAERGLRVLLVAEGAGGTALNDPQGLTALGFLGIHDPLRSGVRDAVERCQRAGVRILMLTGDHPATARAIGKEAGLFTDASHPSCTEVVTASQLMELGSEEMRQRLRNIAVIARAAPLDKLRIVEELRGCGHSVAMTGDGVNDAPSLRLADVGVAMGRTGTEVARQASDVVLADDNFATLVDALLEGRGFWRNMRNSLGLLVGGNAGELGMLVGASVLGFGVPLNSPQILMVNLITDILPSLAVILQRPAHRQLDRLAREGLSALDSSLRKDTLVRGIATALPSLAAYLTAYFQAGPQQASSVAFASVITTQLAQTLDVGRVEGFLSPSVLGAVGGSLGLLASFFAVPPLRNLFGLTVPNLTGWGLVAGSSAAAVLLSRVIYLAGSLEPTALASALKQEVRQLTHRVDGTPTASRDRPEATRK